MKCELIFNKLTNRGKEVYCPYVILNMRSVSVHTK